MNRVVVPEMDSMRGNGRQPERKRKFEKSALKRQAILDAAAETFAEKGYAATRLSDIAERIGTKAGSIYYHFESRDELVEEVLAATMIHIEHAVRESLAGLPENASYRLRMHTAIVTHVQQLFIHDAYMVAYYKLYDQLADDMRQRYAILPRRYGDLWKELLAGARAAGEIRDDLDLSVVRMLLMGAITWTLEWFKKGKRMSAEQVGAQLSAMFFDGMAKPEAAGMPDAGVGELVALLKDQDRQTVEALTQTIRLFLAKQQA